MARKIDPALLDAYRDGQCAGAAGADYRTNPYYYTSAMSDAWALGHWLAETRESKIGPIVGLNTRGLVYEGQNGARYRWFVGYIPCTAGHSFGRVVA